MRTLAIGDMHGCLTALDLLLAEVRPQPDDLLVTLGDYVDRGPDSKGVLDRLLELAQRCRLLPLRGNHEIMMVEARRVWSERQNWQKVGGWTAWLANPEDRPSTEEKEWLQCGGRQTLNSYARDGQPGTLADVPETHWEWLERCQDWYETEQYFFVHANAYPDLPLEEQPSYMLHWEHLRSARLHCSGKVMICGHTQQRSGKPLHLGCAICIDTWAYGDGWLTCLDTDTGQYWQANQRGETRTSVLGMPRR
jgi:serine/threonine protein phosphatase 1